ncbi:MAG TPA: ketoacyl-ACP synthase III [Flavobacterium sp.]|jgi:3-oxoacyl-[acyl-carrier-protein] synthase-3
MYQSFDNILVEGISSCVPKNTVTNERFTEMLTAKEIKMFEKTVGILERRWADKGVTASDLGFAAAADLFASGKFKKEDIKCVIFLSQTPDYKIPFTSNILQGRLGLSNDILCLDINAGCAGFIQGMSTAFSLANSMHEGKVLLIIAETLSKILSPKDRSTTMLFGDGASAIVVSKSDKAQNKAYFNFFTDGTNHQAIRIPDGGYRNEFSVTSLDDVVYESDSRNNTNLTMDGPKVFDFTMREVAPSVEDLLTHFSLDKQAVDLFLFHQSNTFIIKQIANKLGIPSEKVPLNISSFGNTSGVTLPLLLTTSRNLLREGNNKLLFSGYGSGLNWGNMVLEISKETMIRDLIEI